MASENPLVVLLHALVVIALVHALGFWFKWSGRLEEAKGQGEASAAVAGPGSKYCNTVL